MAKMFRSWFANLVKCHVRHPDIVLFVHSYHVRQEEKALAPRIDSVSTWIDRQNSCLGNWNTSIQTICVIPEKRSLRSDRERWQKFSTHKLKVCPVQVLSPLWKITALPYVSMETPESWPSALAVSGVGQLGSAFRSEPGSALGWRPAVCGLERESKIANV